MTKGRAVQLSVFRTYLKSCYEPVHSFEDGDVLWQKMDYRTLLISETNEADR